MEELKIHTGSIVSRILLNEKIANLKNYIPLDHKIIVITDANIRKHYGKFFNEFNVIEIGQGEKNKTLGTIDYIMGKLVDFEADRSAFIVGIGGGIVCDITGFAASVYMRGLRFGFVSASLLSQVDASVGGKNGVNYKGYKNMVGIFNQPEFVICDLDMLKTLDRQEFIGGFGEIIKHGAIKDIHLFEFLEVNYKKALDYNTDVLHRLIRDSIIIKSNVVEQDEKEKGERRKLNYGHTFGHAIEKLTRLSHGKAIAIGMYLAAQASVKMGMLALTDLSRLKLLIENFQLPVKLKIDKTALFNAMKKDKKREGNEIHLVLLNGIGNAEVININYKVLEDIVNDLRLS
jgi:3-dehydroquinate synthase